MPEYMVRFDVRGEINITISADSEDEADSLATKMIGDDDDFSELMLELDEVHEADFTLNQLHRVKRGDVITKTTYVRPGDEVLPDDELPKPKVPDGH